MPGHCLREFTADSHHWVAVRERGRSPETSINYEFGARYDGPVFLEVIGFFSDFSNKGESCSNAYPCSNGATSGTFITGEAVVAGVEVQARSCV